MRLVLLALTLVLVASVVSAGIDSERGSGKVFPSIVSSTPTPLSTSSNDRSRLYYNAIKALYLDGNLSLFVDRVMDGARVGHGRLQWLLGVLYANGVGVPQNDAAALMYYNFAALDGIPEAHVALGARYADGHGVMPNCQSALGHYKEAADAVAMTLNGFSDLSVADNFLNNPKWLDTSSQDSLFSGVISVEEMQEAQHTAVMMGVHMVGAPAQAQMGLGYFLGTIGPRDWNKAEQHFQRAAKEGDALAMGGLGRMYMVGDPGATPPIPRDWALAHHYFTEGAKKNDAMSENGMGYLHSVGYLNKGHVVPEAERFHSRPDFETAAIYFQRAGNRGLAEGLYNLGVLHLHGRGVTKSTDQAEVLLRMASHKGSVLALWQLGKHHERIGACPIALMFYRRTTYSASWYKKDSPSFSVQSADWLDDDFHEQMQHETAAADDGGPDYYMDQGLLHTHEASHEIRVELPETPLSRFLDQLVLAETGRTSSLVGAARLLEEMDVVDGDEPDPDVLHFAKHQTPPPSLAARLNHKRLLLLWSVKDSHGYWRRRRVVQAEAKKLLLHHLLLRCENGNNGYSNLRLGDFFYRGESAVLGVDVERALELYQKAAKDRHSQAEFNVGFIYHIGLRAASDSSRRGPMDVLRQLLQRPTEGDLHLAKRYYDKVMQSNKRAQVAAHIALTSLSFQQWWLGVDVGGYELPFAWVGPFSRRALAFGAYLYHLESVVMVAAIVGIGLCMVLRHHGD